jgi:hypothetical protein
MSIFSPESQESWIMNKVLFDKFLQSKLNGCTELVEISDPSGQVLGHFVPADLYQKMLYAYAERQCPYSKEDQERDRKESGGRTLAEIWTSLGQR